MKYNIFFYFTLVLGLFFADPDFSGLDPEFWLSRVWIRTQKKSLTWIREKKPDPKHCNFCSFIKKCVGINIIVC